MKSLTINVDKENTDTGGEVDRDNFYSTMELNLLIAQGLEAGEMGRLVVTAIPSLLEVPFTALGLLQKDADWLVVGQWRKRPLDTTTAQELASLLATDVAKRAFSSAGSLLLADLPSVAGMVPEPLAKLDVKSLLVAPVRTITNSFGVMMVGREVAQDYTPQQRLLISTVVNQMAIALENMRLREQSRESEENLRESGKKYRGLVNNIKLGIFRSMPEPSGRFLEVNPAMEEITGYSRQELLQMNVSDLYVHPGQREAVLEEIASAKGKTTKELHLRKKDGTEIVVSDTKVAVRDGAGKILYYDGILGDITERKRAEESLRESEEKYRSLFKNMLNAFAYCKILVDENSQPIDYVHLEVNDTWERLVGLKKEDVIGKKITEVIPGIKESKTDLISIYGKVALTGEGAELEFYFEPLGKWFTVSIYSPQKDYFVAVFDDITERKQAEEREKELQQELYLSSRLAAIGELAAGVAHEINNPLTGILGFSQRLLRKGVAEKVSLRDLETIHNEALRAAKVIENLLTFARRRQPKKEYSDINDIVQKAVELRAYELKTSNIEIVTDLATTLPKIMADFGQIQEVFVNIILNAEQAMTEVNRGGKLSIKTQEIKGYVRVWFTDNGPGIATEHLDRLFDPFFTTKGDGTGLGLSVCHGIVAEHGGRIYTKSKPGKGATFFVELPMTTEEADKSKIGEE